MAVDFLQVPPDSSGKKLRVIRFPDNTYVELVTFVDPDTGEAIDFAPLADIADALVGFATQATLAAVRNRLDEVLGVQDDYTNGEVLADQAGAGAVLTFTFTNPMNLVWVRSDGEDVRVDPFGDDPTAALGIICEAGVPNPITVVTTEVKVWAPAGATVHVWGFNRA